MNESDIDNILDELTHNVLDDKIFFQNQFPETKIENSINSFAHDVNQKEIIFLVDETVFGSAKSGLIMTKDKIYLKQNFEYPKSFELSSIRNIAIIKSTFGCRLIINDMSVFEFTQASESAIRKLFNVIKNKFIKPESNTETEDLIDKLATLKNLYEKSLISEQEYELTKRKLLGGL